MTITISTKPEEVKPARTEVLKDTGHHSYSGRSEFLAQLASDLLESGKLKWDTDYSKVSDKQKRELGIALIVMPLVKARYPQNASAAHSMDTLWSAVARHQKAHAAAAAPAPVTETKSESKSSKGKSKSTAKSKRAKRSKSKVEADKLTVAA